MPLGGTIVARATGAGFAPLAIVRISGAETRSALERLLGVVPPARRATSATLWLPRSGEWDGSVPEALTLRVRVIRFEAPRSYTGEDSAELTLPGNPHLVERVIDAATGFPDVRRAEPGEFTARALLNGKMSVDQAEGVAQLIAATSEDQRLAASSLLSGETGRAYRAWADELTTLLALVEAGIDFTDQEDVVPIDTEALGVRLSVLRAELAERIGSHVGGESSEGLPAVALAGAPSAGKSTLFNALLGKARAQTSPEPGTTRDVLREELDLSSEGPSFGRVELLDLAGLDEDASGAIAGEAQRAARAALREAEVVVWCDPGGRFEALGGLGSDARVIRVRTKADLAVGQTADALAVSALDGSNLGALRRAIADAAVGGQGRDAILPRHRAHLSGAVRAIERALDPATVGDAELIAGELRAALDEVGALVGRVGPDDVIGRIFSTFCVGK